MYHTIDTTPATPADGRVAGEGSGHRRADGGGSAGHAATRRPPPRRRPPNPRWRL